MKNSYPIRHTIAVLTAAFLLINAAGAFAQNANGQGAAQGGGQGRRGGGAAALQSMTEDQRAAVQAMNQETQDQSRKVAAARTELNNVIFAEKVDEAQIKEKAAAVAKLDAELAVARAKAFAKIRSKFTSEQIDILKALPAGGRGGGGRRQGNAN